LLQKVKSWFQARFTPLVALSLSIHLLPFFVFFWIKGASPVRLPKPIDKKIFLDVMTKTQNNEENVIIGGKQKIRPRSQTRAQAQPKNQEVPLSLKNLGIPFHITQKPQDLKGDSTTASEAHSSKSSGPLRRKSNQMDLPAEGKASPFFRYVYETIDKNLMYPDELIAKKETGSVIAHIVFSEEGAYLEEETRFETASSYLRVVAARTLRKAFKNSVPKQKWLFRKRTEVTCQFRFEITEHNDPNLAKSKNLAIANQMTFYRHSQRSLLQWDAGPLHGLGPFVGADILWIPKGIFELFSKKAKIDPLENYRNDRAW
jgi:hypothetical protein